MELTVEAQKRPEGQKPRALRRAGLIPAVLYGHKGAESSSLVLQQKDSITLLKKAVANNTLIQLNIPDLSWNGKVLLREIQKHPAKGFLYHLSFFATAAQSTVEVRLPIHYTGEAIGVKVEGGTLSTELTELQVKVAPDSIPEYINVNVSDLHAGQSLHISEIVFPEGVVPLEDPSVLVVSVAPGRGGKAAGAEDGES